MASTRTPAAFTAAFLFALASLTPAADGIRGSDTPAKIALTQQDTAWLTQQIESGLSGRIQSGKHELSVWLDRAVGDPAILEAGTIAALKQMPQNLLVALMDAQLAHNQDIRSNGAIGHNFTTSNAGEIVNLLRGRNTSGVKPLLTETQIIDIAASLLVNAPLGIEAGNFTQNMIEKVLFPTGYTVTPLVAPAVVAAPLVAGSVFGTGSGQSVQFGGLILKPEAANGAFLDFRAGTDHLGLGFDANPEVLFELGSGYRTKGGSVIRFKGGIGRLGKNGMPRMVSGLEGHYGKLSFDSSAFFESYKKGDYTPWDTRSEKIEGVNTKRGFTFALSYDMYAIAARYADITRPQGHDWEGDVTLSKTWTHKTGNVSALIAAQRTSPLSDEDPTNDRLAGYSGRVDLSVTGKLTPTMNYGLTSRVAMDVNCHVSVAAYGTITDLNTDISAAIQALHFADTNDTRVVAMISGPLDQRGLDRDSARAIVAGHLTSARDAIDNLKRLARDPTTSEDNFQNWRNELRRSLKYFSSARQTYAKDLDGSNYYSLSPLEEETADFLANSTLESVRSRGVL